MKIFIVENQLHALQAFIEKNFSFLFDFTTDQQCHNQDFDGYLILTHSKTPLIAEFPIDKTMVICLGEDTVLPYQFVLHFKKWEIEKDGFPSGGDYHILSQGLMQFFLSLNKKIELPFDITTFSKDGKVIKQSDTKADSYSSFFAKEDRLSPKLLASLSKGELHFFHSPGFDDNQYIIETYHVTDTSISRLNLDFMPYLDWYLTETFQSVVGNSDATSSASISILEDDEF